MELNLPIFLGLCAGGNCLVSSTNYYPAGFFDRICNLSFENFQIFVIWETAEAGVRVLGFNDAIAKNSTSRAMIWLSKNSPRYL